MVSIKVFVEGGGNGNKSLKTACRKGFNEFFNKAGLEERVPRTMVCGSRNNAFDDFCTAMDNTGDNDFPILLVDSEDPVSLGDAPWLHLKERDGWVKPTGATDDQAHLMVQCMEAWFMADKDCVERFFGQGFKRNLLPSQTDIESIPKDDLFDKITNATRNTVTMGKYGKGAHSFELLALIDPQLVQDASPHAKRLLETLERIAGSS